jgi:fluoride ion exporter CrcB/FEX
MAYVQLFRYLPLQVGISTGLCGSITTFSSWQLGIFKEFANYAAYPHTRGKNVLSAISEFLVTLAMSLNGLVFGHHIGSWIAPFLFKSMESGTELNVIPRGFSIRYLRKYDYIVILIGVASWLGVMFAAIFAKDQKELALACVFAPFGALLRWYLSFFNGRFKGFPIGTFTANIFGTIVIAVLGLVESGVYVTAIACDVVKGLADGFCGCLTTISTFMVTLTFYIHFIVLTNAFFFCF